MVTFFGKKLTWAQEAELASIKRMIITNRPMPEIEKKWKSFCKTSLSKLAVSQDERLLRREFDTMFENFDQKANQLFNILSTVMKSMKEMQSGTTRNIL